MKPERDHIIHLVSEAQNAGVRQEKACEVFDISVKTLQRWSHLEAKEDGLLEPEHKPKITLTKLERQRILAVCNKPEYADLPPNKIVPKLADTGVYMASESTMYRILRPEKQLAHRLNSKPAKKVSKPKALIATGPNQVYSWDITYLPTAVKGYFITCI